jgi:hypothetical protein
VQAGHGAVAGIGGILSSVTGANDGFASLLAAARGAGAVGRGAVRSAVQAQSAVLPGFNNVLTAGQVRAAQCCRALSL